MPKLPPEKKPISLLATRLSDEAKQKLRESILRHKGDTHVVAELNDRRPARPAPKTKPVADFYPKVRNTALGCGVIARSEEIKAILTANGVDPEHFDVDLFRYMADQLMATADRDEADANLYRVRKYERDGATEKRAGKAGIVLKRLSDVVAVPIEWLWPGRFAIGKLALVFGDPGLGKTWAMIDLAARIATCGDLPDCSNPDKDRRHVLWVSAEDADDDTLKPRFVQQGGDPTRFFSLQFVCAVETDKKTRNMEIVERCFDLKQDLPRLEKVLTDNPAIRLVVIDPVSAFMGGIDANQNAEVRKVTTPLSKLAEKHRVAIIAITHMAKGDGAKAIYRAIGSIGFVAAARTAWLVTADPEDRYRRLFLPAKNNLAPDVGGLAFRIGDDGLIWERDPVVITAGEALLPAGSDADRAPARKEAAEWLRETLADGPMIASEVFDKADADGINEKTLKTAKREIGVTTRKSGGTGSPWVWTLPAAK